MNLLTRDLWQEVRQAFRTDLGVAAADLWLKHTQPLDFSRGVFRLGVPNDVVREWLEHRYRDDLERIFQRLTGSPVRILVQVDRNLAARSLASVPADPAAEYGAVPFLVVAENRLAHAGVQRLLRDPATGNPMFLYGPAGVGKSALIRSLLERDAAEGGGPRTTVTITAEAFSRGLVRAIRERQLSAFRGRMLAADLFVLDEAHRLRGKTRTQRELLTIMRHHIGRGRPFILSSRHPPNAIFLLDEGLRSHFLSGNLLRIADPSPASRSLILTALSRRFVREIPAQTIERIAHRVAGTFDYQVRYLEKAAAFAGLLGESATIDNIGERFPELLGNGKRDLDFGALVELVAREFDTTAEEVASNRKVRRAVLARHLVIYLATVVFNLKARRVMRHLGGLSPSTTAYARRKIEKLRGDDPMFDARVKQLLGKIRAGQQLLF